MYREDVGYYAPIQTSTELDKFLVNFLCILLGFPYLLKDLRWFILALMITDPGCWRADKRICSIAQYEALSNILCTSALGEAVNRW
jgi:hypothetical protein